MSSGTAIEWTDATWNPVVGCTRVSRGCERCYAERMAYRRGVRQTDRYGGRQEGHRPEVLAGGGVAKGEFPRGRKP